MSRSGINNKGGRPKGSKSTKTIDKEIALQELRQHVLKNIRPLLQSAIDNARGLTVMFQKKKVKAKDGKYYRTGELVRVRDEHRVEELLKGNCTGDAWYYITTKDPNIQALKELLDRTFGKPKESLEVSGVEGGPIEISIDMKKALDRAYGNE